MMAEQQKNVIRLDSRPEDTLEIPTRKIFRIIFE
jgi:hypothetical protein